MIKKRSKVYNPYCIYSQKILRRCTGKQTIEGVPVLESLSTIFHYSIGVCLQHQPWILSSPYYSMCALQVISNTLETALLQTFLLNV